MDVVVKKSGIHGKGVFANRGFKKGEVVINWTDCSETLTQEEVSKLSVPKRRYVSFLRKGKWVLFKSPGKFVNHSCEPNTIAISGADMAKKDIRKGEEITADYVSEKIPDLNMKCKCGSKECRGIVRNGN